MLQLCLCLVKLMDAMVMELRAPSIFQQSVNNGSEYMAF